MLYSIKKVEYLDGYKLRLYFKNKIVLIVDLRKIVNAAKDVLLPLKDLEFFKKVKCEYGTIVWPNGADLCPNFLHSIGVEEKKRNSRARRVPLPKKRSIRSRPKVS